MDLSPYKWKNRVVVVQGTESDLAFKNAHKRLTIKKKELVERDVIILNDSSDQFGIYLYGKDGQRKWIGSKDFSVSEILKLIDSMPMRQAENLDKK